MRQQPPEDDLPEGLSIHGQPPPDSPFKDGPTGEPDWQKVQEAYESGEQSVLAIQKDFSITKDRLYRRVHKEGWAGRRSKADPRSLAQAQADGQPSSHLKTQSRAALAARLYRALEERIMAMEDEMTTHDASHSERDAKALTAMARALEMLGEMLETADEQSAARKGANAAGAQDEVNIDEFRQMLTDRLDRLRQGAGGV